MTMPPPDLDAIFARGRQLPPPPGRELDPVRAEALTRAIDYYRVVGSGSAHEVVDTAEVFEGYLAGLVEVDADKLREAIR